jgi:two-component system sensor histidine kinase DevS
MEYRVSPPFRFVGLGLVCLFLIVASVIWAVLARPWIGVALEAEASGTVRVVSVAPDAPAPAILKDRGVVALGGLGFDALPLLPTDLVEDPDKLETYPAFRAFLERQGALDARLTSGAVTLVLENGEAVRIAPAPRRPLWDLSLGFWIQVLSGATSLLVAGWVLMLRPESLSARYLMLTAIALAGSAFAAAIYSSRELALPVQTFRVLSGVNSISTFFFGVGMIGVFLYYRKALLPHRVMGWLSAGILLWWGAHMAQVLPSIVVGMHLMILVLLLVILGVIIWQARASRGDPVVRAGIRWIGQSFLFGAGGCVAIISVPFLVGQPPFADQSVAFGFLLLLFVGIAIGVARHRLFDLEVWSFRLLFYLGAALLLLVVDALFVYVLFLDRAPALALAILSVSFLYLPFRDWLWRRLVASDAAEGDELMLRLSKVALGAREDERREAWAGLWADWFQPLRLEPLELSAPAEPVVAAGGGELHLPAVGGLTALRLIWKRQGRRLFSQRDADAAERVCHILAALKRARDGYERGVLEERTRISRDMHDHIGVQLLGALHSGEAAQKDGLIREALSELRAIVSGEISSETEAGPLLAELRHELSEVLAASGVALEWQVHPAVEVLSLGAVQAQTTRAVLREAVANVVKHAEARTFRAWVDLSETGALVLRVADDGQGMGKVQALGGGNGLRNMRQRVEELGGSFWQGDAEAGGLCLEMALPRGLR